MTTFFRALHAFRGDHLQGQHIFEAGAVLVVVDPSKSNVNGWAQGLLMNDLYYRPGQQTTKVLGWFPVSYVERIMPPQGSNIEHRAVAKNLQQRSANHNPGWNNPPIPISSANRAPVLPTVTADEDDDDDFGFGGPPMGGSWNGSTAMSGGGSGFGSTTVARSAANFGSSSEKMTVGAVPVSSTSPTLSKRLSAGNKKIGDRISQAASRTGTAFSNAASRTAAATKSALNETGHRLNDMRDQHNARLDQRPPSHRHTSIIAGKTKHSHIEERKIVSSSDGFCPGRKTDTTTTTQRGPFGAKTTTVTKTEKASGGFMPWVPGKTTTTQTTKRDAFGRTTVTTEHKSGGGLYIIPLGPIGLAACGAVAAKNAYDSHQDRQRIKQL